MNIYLAGCYSRQFVFDETMDIYLAGAATGNNVAIWRDNSKDNPAAAMEKLCGSTDKIYVLESFYYMKNWMTPYIKNHWNFMLDSGAFTFMEGNQGSQVKWDDYVSRYCDFINKHDIDLFFELDIDSVSTLSHVEAMRKKIEARTGKQSIPVWHRSRGKDYFIQMCKDYDYVAIGGLVSGEWKGTDPDVFKWFINTAHEHGSKIHALGYTNLKGLEKYKFDSVDSTAWTSGNRFGCLYYFKNGELKKIMSGPKQRMAKPRELAVQNFKAWLNFQRYAKQYM